MPELKADAVIAAITNQRNGALNEAVRLQALFDDAQAEIQELKIKLATSQEDVLNANGLSLVEDVEVEEKPAL